LTRGPNAERYIEKLRRDHEVETFNCGEDTLNRFLQRFALQNQQSGASKTYIARVGVKIVGYYSLSVGQVVYEDAPSRLAKGLARYPIPIMLLARLAVDVSWQGKGIGSGLLKDAMIRTLNAADIAGIRAIAVHAKNERARQFYEHFDFVPSPSDPLHLFILLKDVRRLVTR
jgi:GNAT superfamily N-acetyltransferase